MLHLMTYIKKLTLLWVFSLQRRTLTFKRMLNWEPQNDGPSK